MRRELGKVGSSGTVTRLKKRCKRSTRHHRERSFVYTICGLKKKKKKKCGWVNSTRSM